MPINTDVAFSLRCSFEKIVAVRARLVLALHQPPLNALLVELMSARQLSRYCEAQSLEADRALIIGWFAHEHGLRLVLKHLLRLDERLSVEGLIIGSLSLVYGHKGCGPRVQPRG